MRYRYGPHNGKSFLTRWILFETNRRKDNALILRTDTNIYIENIDTEYFLYVTECTVSCNAKV